MARHLLNREVFFMSNSPTNSMPAVPSDNVFRLLLLESDETTARTILGFLEKTGFDCQAALSAEQGMALFKKQVPHLLIVPALTPNIDGHAFCRWVREHSTIPILMRGVADESAEVAAFKIGADDYLPAPLRPAVLMARVVAHLRRAYRYNAPPEPVENPFGLAMGEDVPEDALPAGWAECELCGHRAPRHVFEKEDIMGRMKLICPRCNESDHVIISID